MKVNGTTWDASDLEQTAQLVAALKQEAQQDRRSVKHTPTPETLPVAWDVLNHLRSAPVPAVDTLAAVSWFWLTHTLARASGRSSVNEVIQRWPGVQDNPPLWEASQAWGLDPLAHVPSSDSATTVWELGCDENNPLYLNKRDRWPQPPAFVWACQHVPDAAQAFLTRQGWKEIHSPVSSSDDADTVYRRLSHACLPKEAKDEHGTHLVWALVNRHPKTLLKLVQWDYKPDFNRDRSGQGHDLWWAALGAPYVQNNFTNKVLDTLRRLGAPEVGPEGKGWLVAHPEWIQNLTFYAQVQGGPQTNQAVRRNLRQVMGKNPAVAWAGTEADHHAMVQQLWTGEKGRHAAREMAEWALWIVPVLPEASFVTPTLRGFFIQCLVACAKGDVEDFKLPSQSHHDPNLWSATHTAQVQQRLKEHLALPYVLPEGLPTSPDWQELLQSPHALAITRTLLSDHIEPAPERRRSRYRS